ncbi:Peptidoglycan/xylan/chitin deacetylase, PgdA/CDA1 family [Natronincola peptidivorans]|uniref:Peptidoglycan/xylan/chitin deacetylase, PgdA/CDA1 family n=1 Tax=Natronincola peptidivorans TaxID=426128 RepID=A0A1I0FZ34_9FIRM|nr:LysM peptidoglycan-binding domain-containing protein [Natronincola peptidivorans]SET63581.1 Peptidoglycan/xylan/chitin deacetylase, PgdA/CDA1 family [Natronincola peptidivorans]
MKKLLRFTITIGMIMLLLMPSFAEAAQVHRVARGETLFLIAQRHGVTVNELITQNGYLRNPNNISVGQVLVVPKQEEPNVYMVRQGDTLYKISQKLGVSLTDLAIENNISNWNHIYVGQKLSVPANGANTSTGSAPSQVSADYVVKRGDSLYKISQELGVSMAALAEANSLKDWNTIYIGQVLKVPSTGVTPPAEAPKQPEASPQLSMTQLARMYPDTYYLRGSANTTKIALTFDDGPNPKYTPQILDVLKQQGVPATFFVMGSRVERHPEIVQRIAQEGHVVANHTWIHPDLSKVPQVTLLSEMQRTEDIIHKVTGLRTSLMRPPYGRVNPEGIEKLRDMNYKVINWSVDSVDWRDQDVDQILINTLPGVRQGGILLFHDAGGDQQTRGATAAALPEIIHTLRSQGYEFVTVDELLNLPAYK